MVKYTGRGLVVKRPGVLSKVQVLDLVLGVGVFSLLPNIVVNFSRLPVLTWKNRNVGGKLLEMRLGEDRARPGQASAKAGRATG